MKIQEFISPEMLYHLRKSDIDLISKSLVNNGGNNNASYIALSFAILLKQLRNIDEAELDHVTGISAQLAMTGLWNNESISMFANNVLHKIDRKVMRAVKDGMSAEISSKMENAFNRIKEIRREIHSNINSRNQPALTVKLTSSPRKGENRVVVVHRKDGRLVDVIGHYSGSISKGVADVSIDTARLSKLIRKKPRFTASAMDLVAQGVYLEERKRKK